MKLDDRNFLNFLLWKSTPQASILTDTKAAKLLMTPTRDARVAGPDLREAHRRIGWYLAMHKVSEIIGVEEYQIPHVQGKTDSGYRLLNEKKTCIVALMRGGEPMALGVNDAFPLASLVHAKKPEDLKPEHLKDQKTVLLVDSVINSGKSVVEFLQYLEEIKPGIRIVIIAGVVQEDTLVSKNPDEDHNRGKPRGVPSLYEQKLSAAKEKETDPRSALFGILCRSLNIDIVALRSSGNKFTGSGTTDTGNRLFNTTNLE